MPSVLSISNLSKTYASGFKALKNVDLDIQEGEIFALLGPNGAGKTTLIGIVCGIVNASGGTVTVAGHDIKRDFRATRSLIGLLPQSLAIQVERLRPYGFLVIYALMFTGGFDLFVGAPYRLVRAWLP